LTISTETDTVLLGKSPHCFDRRLVALRDGSREGKKMKKILHRGSPLGTVAVCLLTAGVARAGTVITSNLPAGVSIVNVDGRADGSATFSNDAPQSFWYGPTASAVATASVAVVPGTYTFRVISQADAATQFPALTQAQRDQMYTAWTYNSPWTTNYMAFTSASVGNTSVSQIFDGGSVPAGVSYNTSSPANAYASLISSGYDNNLRLAPPGRAGTTPADFASESYTFTSPTTLIFAVPDNGLGDNNGGVSIVVTAPEPTSAAVLAGAVGMLLTRRRRRSS
jgi:hypothetical protein